MRPSPLLFCALILLSATLRATPAEDFMARGKELLANTKKLSEPDRLHRLFNFSCVLEKQLKEWVAKAKKA